MEIKLIIQDEVNIKFVGLPLEARKKLSNKFKYQVPYAKYHPAYRLGRWDGMVSLFSIGGEGYLSQLETIFNILDSMNLQVTDLEDHRNKVNLSLNPIDENYWINQGVVWPSGHQNEGNPILLRDYQVDAINKFLTNPQALQELATSSGKTIITATLSHICESIGRTLTIVPNKSLVEQTEEDFLNVGLDVGVYYGDRKDLYKTHTICTWQSLEVLNKKSRRQDPDTLTLSKFLDGVKAVIVDECFDGDTLITTPSGKIPIKDLKAGDKIINFCENTLKYKEDTIIQVHKNLTTSSLEPMLELTFDNNQTIKVTANHKFLTTTGWVRADELTNYMEVININTYKQHEYQNIKNVTKFMHKKIIEKPTEVYNLHIEDDHNYIANEVIVANCHRSSAEILRNLLTRNLVNAPIRWGLTGTVPKLPYEYESIFASIGPVIGGIKAHELQEQGVLSNCHVHIKQLLDFVEFKSYQEELKYLVTTGDRIQYIGNLIKEIAKSGNTFVLVDRIESGKQLETYLDNSEQVSFVSGAVKTKDRKETYDEIKSADNKIIIATYGVASTGINIPRIFNLVLLEPGKSFTRVIQSIGRGLRKANDKDHVEIYDISSTCKYSKKHLLERKRYYSEAKYPFTVEKIDWKSH